MYIYSYDRLAANMYINNIIERLPEVLGDSVLDTIKLIPFLFITYLAMEALEHSAQAKTEQLMAKADRSGPLVGSLLGALPQCGFSAMAATLYAARVVSAGTLVAVILSTSDEMIPVFVAHQESPGRLLALVGAKVLVGAVIGFVVDVILRALHKSGDGHAHIKELCEVAHCHCDDAQEEHILAHVDERAHTHAHAHTNMPTHTHTHAHAHAQGRFSRLLSIARSAAIHTVEVSSFILIVTFVFGLLIEMVGQDSLASFMGVHPLRATLLSALIGLIPNCAASVTLSELLLSGTLASGPAFAGLLVSGGMGLLILFRTNQDLRQNLVIAAFIYVVAVIVGLCVQALGIVF